MISTLVLNRINRAASKATRGKKLTRFEYNNSIMMMDGYKTHDEIINYLISYEESKERVRIKELENKCNI